MNDQQVAPVCNEPLVVVMKNLIPEIGEWSQRNFGENVSKETGQEIRELGPFLGVVEECGECYESDNYSDILDSVADRLVFLCDFIRRDHMDLNDITVEYDPEQLTEKHLLIILGKWAHIQLKRHQGIRGFNDCEKYRQHRAEVISKFLGWTILNYGEEVCCDALNRVWNKVKHRNWKADPATAGGHA